MIVICTKCQAKFRVADDKIGPRGAKVRCSKCQTVFLVHPVLGTLPVSDGGAGHEKPGGAGEPTAAHGRVLAASAPSRAKGSLQAPTDPFGGADPFAPPAAPSQDPFAPAPRPERLAPPAAPSPDPFGGADPFAPPPAAAAGPGLGDPFVAAVVPRSTLPVTDLSDLLGGPAAPAPAPAKAPPPLPGPPPLPVAAAPLREAAAAGIRGVAEAPQLADPFASPAPTPVPAPAPDSGASAPELADPFAAPGPAAAAPAAPQLADPFAVPAPAAPAPAEAAPADPFGGDPFAAQDVFAAAGTPAEAAPSLELAAPSPPADDGGLSLEERLTPPPTRGLAPAVVTPQLDVTLESLPGASAPAATPPPAGPAGSASDLFDAGAFDLGGGDAGEAPGGPDLDTRTPPPAPALRPEPPEPVAAPPPPALAAASPEAPALTPAPAAAADRIPGGRSSRLRTAAVNAVALFALLVVALALWAVWRTDGPFEAGMLRPSALLSAVGRGGAAAGPWSAQDVRSGVYERVRGAPLLFVRGRVISRAPAAVPAVRIAVRVVRGAEVLARGEAIAGAVPTPEELYLAVDDAAIAAAAAAARPRAPVEVRPGDSVPFLVAIGDAPPELEGASLQIEVASTGGGAP